MRVVSVYQCRACHERVSIYADRCPSCGAPGMVVRDDDEYADATAPDASVPLRAVRALRVRRLPTGVRALDRVLGGGAALGSAILLGGSEGSGKSTLMLQACAGLAQLGPTLYIAAEQEPEEVRGYAERLGLDLPTRLRLLREPTLAAIEAAVARRATQVLVVDALNTISTDEGEDPGGPRQLKACTKGLVALAKAGRAVFVVAHLNNENQVAGSRRLRYLVDVVLRFEREANESPGRRLLATKNRFGPAGEIVRFEMTERGLR